VGRLKQLEFGLRLVREIANSEVAKHAKNRAIEIVSERAQKIAANDRLPELVCGAAGMVAVLLASENCSSPCEEDAASYTRDETDCACRSAVREEKSAIESSACVIDNAEVSCEQSSAASEVAAEEIPESRVQSKVEVESQGEEVAEAEPVTPVESEEPSEKAAIAARAEGKTRGQRPAARGQARRGTVVSPKAGNVRNKSAGQAKKTADKSPRKK